MDVLYGKAYAITGGNSGIGRATAHELVRRGAQVAIFGRDRQTLDAHSASLGLVRLRCKAMSDAKTICNAFSM